jgi:VanZ family protein
MIKIFFFLLASIILYLCLIPSSGSDPTFPHFDKFAHCSAFTLLGLLLMKGFKSLSIIKSIAILTAFGAIIEVLQYFTSYRTFSLADLVFDVIGAAIGSTITRKFL